MKKPFPIKKSTFFLFLAILIIVYSGLTLYYGHDVRANPDAHSDAEKLGTVLSNFAGIGGIIVGIGMLLAAYIRLRIEKSQAAAKATAEK